MIKKTPAQAQQNILGPFIQKVATGPEYSKDLSYDEAYQAMQAILKDDVDPVQAGVFLIALRMKRETEEENKGLLQAIIDTTEIVTAQVDKVLDIADPYDGYTRGLPASPFLPPLFAACGMAAISHGVKAVGPKYGVTHHQVLRAAGYNVDLTPQAAASRLSHTDIGWAYIDQRQFCPRLHQLIDLRGRIIKRPALSTIEVLIGPIRGRKKTCLFTGYVHKAYPALYAQLARHAGFDSALIIRGVEGGIIPSLKQPAKLHYYHGKAMERSMELNPTHFGIQQHTRAVPLPKECATTQAMAETAAKAGIAALKGKTGPCYDSLLYAAALCLAQLGRYDSVTVAAEAVRKVLDSGAALARLEAHE